MSRMAPRKKVPSPLEGVYIPPPKKKWRRFDLDPLKEESLDDFLGSLQFLRSHGYSTSFSPTSVLLEGAIDLCLELKRNYSPELQTKLQEFNPVIKFDYEKSDELGNPRSTRIRQFEKAYFDPDGEEFFTSLSSFFVLIKNRATIKDSFMKSFESASFFPPKHSEQRTQKSKQREKQLTYQGKNLFYFRRKRQREQSSKVRSPKR